ncbi:hypothetical protein TNCV_2630541 [Trichonephila clavipes]|uniref:Uncharacterized protein n=1 Tax=Trichonephila clavipes TaxID=2585209 RepID=A0A8X6SJP4_TRICX|nr:hypothetical protein TNCV_2630541 [Trichonephila clavipes]
MDAEALAFARDLMRYCFRTLSGTELELKAIDFRGLPRSPFTSTMGRALVLYSKSIHRFIYLSVVTYMEPIMRDKREFLRLAQVIADAFYEDCVFFEWTATCSFIVKTCLLLHTPGDETLALMGCYAVSMVYLKFKTQFLLEGGWRNYHVFCCAHVLSLKAQGIEEPRYHETSSYF